ncbi:hypothetical protein OIU84_001542 [Salix udensis]|uniref:Uncharacterized protein n=1 Tax=Salix udensis TaxID=889485 RepID=A0AAD6K726_9ROSI|nr:hypothetical protein OIU84_001542 [Salix udensis]
MILILGNLHQLGSHPHRKLHSLAKCYGPLMMLHFGSKPALMVSSADAAQKIMKTHDLIFSNRPKLRVSYKLLHQGKDISTAPYVNLSEMFATLTNDIICRVALGRKHSEGKGGTRGTIGRRLRWLNHVNGFNARVDRVAKEFDRFLDGVIEEHMVSKTGGSVHGEDQQDFVDVLLELQKDNLTGFLLPE